MLRHMAHVIEPEAATPAQIVDLEKTSLRMVFHAMCSFALEAVKEFRDSPDEPDGIAEDLTRDALSRFPGFPLPQRIYGTMDFRRSGYAFFPTFAIRQALMVDSKAEKAALNARLQTNQTSLPIWQRRGGSEVREQGGLPTVIQLGDLPFLTTTVFVHYHYEERGTGRPLKAIRVIALPNGRLASDYVKSADDHIWLAGPNAPTRGEAFRTRLSFSKLAARAAWRVQKIPLDVPLPDRIDPNLYWVD